MIELIICCECHIEFEPDSDWNDEDAREEFKNNFGRYPTEEEIKNIVCDDCYKKFIEPFQN